SRPALPATTPDARARQQHVPREPATRGGGRSFTARHAAIGRRAARSRHRQQPPPLRPPPTTRVAKELASPHAEEPAKESKPQLMAKRALAIAEQHRLHPAHEVAERLPVQMRGNAR